MIPFFLIVLFFTETDGMNEDLFENLWENVKQPASLNCDKSKIEQPLIKKELIGLENENSEQQNQVEIKEENRHSEKIEDIKPRILIEIKKEPFINQSDADTNTKTKVQTAFPDHKGPIRQKQRFLDDEKHTKIRLIEKFDQTKAERMSWLKYDNKKKSKIETEIAQNLRTSRNEIYRWKKELGLLKKYSIKQKKEIIEQFETLKKEFSKKFNFTATWEINLKIAKKIGFDYSTIYRWEREFGIIKRKNKLYTDVEKVEIVKEFNKIKKANPMVSSVAIAEQLAINRSSLKVWMKNFSGIKEN